MPAYASYAAAMLTRHAVGPFSCVDATLYFADAAFAVSMIDAAFAITLNAMTYYYVYVIDTDTL